MKSIGAVFCALLVGAASANDAQTNPLGTVVSLIDGLAAKITRDGEAEAAAFKEYFEWCDDAAQNMKNDIKTATSQKDKLEATIADTSSNIAASTSKIEDLAAAIASSEAELKDATAIRAKESEDFVKAEAELVDGVDTLGRAIAIITREMQKNPAAFTQVDTSSISGLLQSLSVVIDAAAFSSNDKQKLTALVQSQQSSESEDSELGAPEAATYKSHSSGITDVLEDMKEKAEGQLSDLRKAESNTKHNFEMLRQSLEAQAAADTKDMNDEKASKAENEEHKATAEGDLAQTVKELTASKDGLAEASTNCMTVAADHQATMQARAEELSVIAKAKEILQSTSSGAVDQTYSLFQVATDSRLRTRADLKNSEVVALLKRLAQKHHSSALAQLASRINAVLRFGTSNGDDVFSKVKELIQDLISKLESEAGADATEKSYCDEEMAKTEAKKGELNDDISKLSAKIDQAASNSARLKGEAKELQAELSALAKLQAEMDKIRQDTHAEYATAKADLDLGLDGIRKALGLLRDYYNNQGAALVQDDGSMGTFMQQPAMPEKHEASSGAGNSIIGILEVCEADFAKNLAKEEMEEADAQSDFDKTTQENKITKATKDQDDKYKTQEFKSLDKSVSELSGDRKTTSTELAAVLEYYEKIKERCIAKPETYEDRRARRTAEISGLKQALEILESETAFVQRKHRGSFRRSLLA